jgi:GNAT superfamily N-acetyltransferase
VATTTRNRPGIVLSGYGNRPRHGYGHAVRIRPAVPDDAAAVVALRAVVHPYLVRGTAATRRLIAEPPAGEDWAGFVAEDRGRVVGWVSGKRNVRSSEPGAGDIALLHVHPEHRGRGAGGALFDAVREHLDRIGVRQVRTTVLPEALDFARARGFEPGRELRYSALSLRPAPGPPAARGGVRLVPVSALDARRMYEAEAAGAADEPDDLPSGAVPFEVWRYDVWENPDLDREASVAALVGPAVAAFSLVVRDGDRMWSDMTATLPEHRGRGLARLVKSAALHRAAARGVVTAYTANDEENAPMLAINARLGYRPMARQLSCVATFG